MKRTGEAHHRTKHSDARIRKLRDLHEHRQIGYRRLAEQFEMPLSTVDAYLSYRRRPFTPNAPIEEGKSFR